MRKYILLTYLFSIVTIAAAQTDLFEWCDNEIIEKESFLPVFRRISSHGNSSTYKRFTVKSPNLQNTYDLKLDCSAKTSQNSGEYDSFTYGTMGK